MKFMTPPNRSPRDTTCPAMLTFWHEASPEARRALMAASLGWLLDAFDVMLYALVLASLIGDLGMDPATGGLLGSLTLAASAAGGHRLRRPRRSLGPDARAVAQHPDLFGLHRRLRLRPERDAARRVPRAASASAWAASGRAARRSCRRPGRREHRGKALGLMQSCWAIGYGAAAHRHGARPARATAGAPSSSSACCRRSSRSGFAAASLSRRCGSSARREPAACRAASRQILRGPAARPDDRR